MALSLSPSHLRRYKDLGRLLIKYGRAGIISRSELDDLVAETGEEAAAAEAGAKPEELARDLEALGPTFIKLGQVLSTRADLLPLPYLEALARLQDNVAPFPFAEVEAIVREELEVRLSKAFPVFDPKPLAAASLGQVHRATLRDGREVAIKVQRPRIRETIAEDLEALDEVARFLDARTEIGRRYRFTEIMQEFRRTLAAELDYRREAQNLKTLGENLAQFERLLVPQPIDDLTTSRVLTMDYVRGTKVTKLSPLARIDVDGDALAAELFRAYLHQILVDGFFHADPHPGNVFITDDGRLALLDLGMVGHVSPGLQEKLLKLVLAVADGKGEDAARVAAEIGEKREFFDEATFVRELAGLVVRHQRSTVEQIEVGRVVLELARAAGENGIRVPSELTLLGKTLLQLDLIGRQLDPQFDPNAAVRRSAAEITSLRLRQSATPSNLFATFIDFKEFVEQLPGRANRILDKVANNELSLQVKTIDERLLVAGIQKVANRITLGLVLAALIVGAALLMQVQTSFRLFGYPGLAMLCFMIAGAGGVLLVVNILASDVRARKRR